MKTLTIIILFFSLKQANKKADNLQQELQMACDALEDVCIDDSNDFGNDFLDSLIKFSRAAASNKDAHKKVKDLQTLSVERGIVMQQTNISPEQIKAQLPFFNGASSLSVLDALDTWIKNLTNAGIHRQMWGGIILSKIENPALSSIPP